MTEKTEKVAGPKFKKANGKKYPNRPDVDGEHYGRWVWPGPGSFEEEIDGEVPAMAIQGLPISFREGLFDKLEELGWQWHSWAAA